MGNFQSIFYPDNPNRRKRVQQLSDDCTDCKQQYNATKTKLENELGPYKDKLDNVLKAFNCTNVADLDKLVQSSVSGADLDHWNHVVKVYDDSQTVDNVLMGIQGVVLVGGLSISVIGSLAGGIGFFAGLGVTTEIELVLGAVEIIYDLIDGAIQRAKMRDAINSLVPCRLKAKFVQEQMDELYRCIPAIKDVYDAFEKAGYNKDKIMNLMKDGDVTKSLQQHTKQVTYNKVGQELVGMDSGRQSWTNEDPDWHPIAASLEEDYQKKQPNVAHAPPGFSKEMFMARVSQNRPPPPIDGDIKMQFQDPKAVDFLKQPLHVLLVNFESGETARAKIKSANDSKTLVVDRKSWVVSMKDTSQVPDNEAPHWILSFVNPKDGPLFSTAGKNWDPSKIPKKVHVFVRLYLENASSEEFPYLTSVGEVIPNASDNEDSHILVSYASD